MWNFSEVESVHLSGGVSPKHSTANVPSSFCSSICFFKKQQQSAVKSPPGQQASCRVQHGHVWHKWRIPSCPSQALQVLQHLMLFISKPSFSA